MYLRANHDGMLATPCRHVKTNFLKIAASFPLLEHFEYEDERACAIERKMLPFTPLAAPPIS